jgi:hypothetical protein
MPDELGDSPLTCGTCRHSPATHLLVADLGTRKPLRAERLTCRPCADLDLKHARPGDHLYLYRLEPEEIRECLHCRAPVRRCTSTCATSPDYLLLCKGWRHVGYDDQPVIGHCCGGRSINPVAEVATAETEEGND